MFDSSTLVKVKFIEHLLNLCDLSMLVKWSRLWPRVSIYKLIFDTNGPMEKSVKW